MNGDIERSSGLMFGEFLELLRRQGFSIGIDHYLRLHELLDKTGGRFAPSDLKTLLCPIFATNRSQQELFYRTFDAHFVLFRSETARVEERPAATETSEEVTAAAVVTPPEGRPRPKPIRSWIYILAGIWLATLAMAMILLWQPQTTGPATGSAPAVPEEPPASTIAPGKARAQAAQSAIPSTAPGTEPTFYRRHAKAIQLAVVLAALALCLLYWLGRRRRRQLVLQKHHGKKPPYTWPIRVEGFAPKLYDADRLHAVTRHLRRRQADEYERLDVPATVKATIEALGYPTFCYKAASKQPEYLVLIDRTSFRDHQAQFFNGLAKTLEREGIFITRYFYDGDPRVCSGERGGGIALSELQRAYRGHRLLVFGDGRRFIDPLTGRLAEWAAESSGWQERALLTPTAPAEWGWTEINLANRFVLLPATVDGLFALIQHFESRSSPDLREWRASSSVPAFPALGRQDTVEALRDYLGADAFQWLSACALYPELHWDLTLYLGSLPAWKGKLLREENLLRLIRLPWFRTGSIPDEIRLPLIRELDRDKEQQVRASILSLLEKSAPPAGSVAADAYQLDLVIQRWLVRRDGKSYREMLRVMREEKRSKDVRDYALLQFQGARRTSPLDILLPETLRKRFDGLGFVELARSLAETLVLLPFRTLPPWLSRALVIALPSAVVSILILYGIARFWGRVPLLVALGVFLALPPLWSFGRIARRWFTVQVPPFVLPRGAESAAIAPESAPTAAPGKRVRSVRRRWLLAGASLIVILATLGVSVELYRRDHRLNALALMAESVFYQMRASEAQLVSQRDTMSPEEFRSLRNRRIKLEQDYDRYLHNLGQYAGKSPVQLAIMRLARSLGETDLELDPDFQRTVLQYVERWRNSPRLRAALDRARQRSLLSRIRLALDGYGLPREFAFLALQESAFDTTAVGPETRLGIAKGMWQLMPETASEYGLAIGPLKDLPQYDPWDQRHDENRATLAAARYLAYLYSTKTAGSGLLAIACYNYGQTRIIEKLDQLPNDPRQRNFWYFWRNGWIPSEARLYVMSVFSAALICEKPDLFNFSIEPVFSLWDVPPARASFLRITIDQPGARVRIDGGEVEQTGEAGSTASYPVNYGIHTVVLSKEGFETVRKEVDVPRDGVFLMRESLHPMVAKSGPAAQPEKGGDFCAVTGEIADKTDGRKLQGVRVVLTNVQTRAERGTITDASGKFLIDSVYPPGRYAIGISLPGYHSYELKDVWLAVNDTRTIAPPLQMLPLTYAVLSVFRLGPAARITLDDELIGSEGEVNDKPVAAGRHRLSVANAAGRQVSQILGLIDGQTAVFVYDSAIPELRPMVSADRARLTLRRTREEIHIYEVEHRHLLGQCRGTLRVSGLNVEYRSAEDAHSFSLPFSGLKLTVKDNRLEMGTEDGKRSWVFRIGSAGQASEVRGLWENLQKLAR